MWVWWRVLYAQFYRRQPSGSGHATTDWVHTRVHIYVGRRRGALCNSCVPHDAGLGEKGRHARDWAEAEQTDPVVTGDSLLCARLDVKKSRRCVGREVVRCALCANNK
jgi:hypothetical protein